MENPGLLKPFAAAEHFHVVYRNCILVYSNNNNKKIQPQISKEQIKIYKCEKTNVL